MIVREKRYCTIRILGRDNGAMSFLRYKKVIAEGDVVIVCKVIIGITYFASVVRIDWLARLCSDADTCRDLIRCFQ